MSFIDSVKKKVFGDDSQLQKAAHGGRRVGSMGKAYTGAGGSYVSSSKGVGFDASSYSDAKPKGRVGSLNEFNPNRMGGSKSSEKGLAGKALDYGVSKAKSGIGWMQERGHELNESQGYERSEHKKGRKKVSGRVPRGSQPPGYDGSYDMFGVGSYGGGGGGNWVTQGTIISGGEAYEEVVPRRRKSRRRPARESSGGGGGFGDMNHIPEHMRDMF